MQNVLKYSVNHRIYLSSFGIERPTANAARNRQAISLMGLLTFVIKNPLTSASIAAGWVAVGYVGYYAYRTGSWISWATSPKTYIQASQEILEGTKDIASKAAEKVSSVPDQIAGKIIPPEIFNITVESILTTEGISEEIVESPSLEAIALRESTKTVVKFSIIGGVIATLSYSVYSFWTSSE